MKNIKSILTILSLFLFSTVFSQDRLGNVIQMLSDLGLCSKNSNGKFLISKAGTVFLNELEGQS